MIEVMAVERILVSMVAVIEYRRLYVLVFFFHDQQHR